MKNRLISMLVLTTASFFLITNAVLSQNVNYKIVKKISLSEQPRYDYLSIDEKTQKLYVSNSTSVHVINITTLKSIGKIDDLNGVHGIAIVSDLNKGFISNGGNNTVTVFDLSTLKVIQTIKLNEKKPDAIVYEPYTTRIFTFNGGSSNATAIDAKTNKVIGTVELGGSPEFSCSNEKGKMYVNLEDKSEVVCFDPKDLKVLSRWKLAPCENPSAMAMDIAHNRLFIGGRNKLMVVVDALSGKVIQSLPIGAGVDASAFDNSQKLVFFSNREGTITVIKEETKDNYKVVNNIKTMEGARTMVLDKTNHLIFTSTVIDTQEKNGKKESTFGVLVLDNK